MALPSLPLATSRFVVEIDGIAVSAFGEVVMPEFSAAGDAAERLELRRAVAGGRELYDWWDAARGGRRDAERNLVVTVFDASGEPGLRWRFLSARPVAIRWSVLDAGQSGFLMETLTLGFKRMDLG